MNAPALFVCLFSLVTSSVLAILVIPELSVTRVDSIAISSALLLAYVAGGSGVAAVRR